jgi:hypothetical protein
VLIGRVVLRFSAVFLVAIAVHFSAVWAVPGS